MYSENDYRYYLAHGKWTWPNGKNSKEYNHDYYSKHKDKWKEYNLARKLGIGYKSAIDEENRKAAGYDARANRAQDAADRLREAGRQDNKHWIGKDFSFETDDDYWDELYEKTKNNPMAPWESVDDYKERIGAKKTRKDYQEMGYDVYDFSQPGAREAAEQRSTRKERRQSLAVAKSNQAKSNREKATTARSTAKQYEAEYAKTPIGRAEAAYNRGKKAFNDALKKLKG